MLPDVIQNNSCNKHQCFCFPCLLHQVNGRMWVLTQGVKLKCGLIPYIFRAVAIYTVGRWGRVPRNATGVDLCGSWYYELNHSLDERLRSGCKLLWILPDVGFIWINVCSLSWHFAEIGVLVHCKPSYWDTLWLPAKSEINDAIYGCFHMNVDYIFMNHDTKFRINANVIQ